MQYQHCGKRIPDSCGQRPAIALGAANGHELEIVTPAATEIIAPEVNRLATLHTNARTDQELSG
jgi:hypothetical protein